MGLPLLLPTRWPCSTQYHAPAPCTLLAADLYVHHGGVLHLPLDVLVLPRGADRVPAAVARLRHRQPGTSSQPSRDQLSANHSSPVQTGLGLLLLAELDLDADLLLVLLAALRPHHVVIVHTWTPAPMMTGGHEMSEIPSSSPQLESSPLSLEEEEESELFSFFRTSFGALLILPYLSPGWGFLSLTIVTSGATAESIILLLKYNI